MISRFSGDCTASSFFWLFLSPSAKTKEASRQLATNVTAIYDNLREPPRGQPSTTSQLSRTWRVAPLFARQMETTLLDPVFRLGLRQRFGYSAPGTGQRFGRTLPGGKQCTNILDPHGRHAACCTKALHTRRHDSIRDLIAKLAWQVGLTATTEQAMLIPDRIMSDGQPAPGSVRPIHRADVHIIKPAGSELWLDVKIHTVTPDLAIDKELLREEHQMQGIRPERWVQIYRPWTRV